jgi:hypothetical protein
VLAAEWVAHQLLEAFPWDSAPHYLFRDRDGSYGEKFRDADRFSHWGKDGSFAISQVGGLHHRYERVAA